MSQTSIKDHTDVSSILGQPYKTILFNDNDHDMLEVTAQIIKAINCDATTATALMLEANNTGSAVVFTGHREKCELVSAVLEEIRLATKVEQA